MAGSQVFGNVVVQPRDAREASDVFYRQRIGDVLLTYENEVVLTNQVGGGRRATHACTHTRSGCLGHQLQQPRVRWTSSACLHPACPTSHPSPGLRQRQGAALRCAISQCPDCLPPGPGEWLSAQLPRQPARAAFQLIGRCLRVVRKATPLTLALRRSFALHASKVRSSSEC